MNFFVFFRKSIFCIVRPMPDKYGISVPHDLAGPTRAVGVADLWVLFSPITTLGLQTRTEQIMIPRLSTLHLPAIQRLLEQGIKSFCLPKLPYLINA